MLVVGAEIDGRTPLDLRCSHTGIVEIAANLPRIEGEEILEAAGAALLPGLHDHHLHLFALAAAESSARCGPPEVISREDLFEALTTARTQGDWIRGIGYHESVAGELDRKTLDEIVSDRPLRVQHRSGAMWIVNSVAAEILGIDRADGQPGIERDHHGRATGRLFRCDAWLRERLAERSLPDLGSVGRRLAGAGVTGVTDASASNSAEELSALATACDNGELLQRVLVMGSEDLPLLDHPLVTNGPLKIILDERALPSLDDLSHRVQTAHRRSRSVAVHCVTRTELVLAATAFEIAGAVAQDRIEHASVAPPEAVELLADLGLTVVTQPGFIHERGDAYLIDVEPRDLPWLYRCQGFLEAGVPLGGGTDSPFGAADPWLAMNAAVNRSTASGHTLGGHESLTPERALALFTSPAQAPGAPPRAVEVGAPADLCLLDRPWAEARQMLSSKCVKATIAWGSLVWQRD